MLINRPIVLQVIIVISMCETHECNLTCHKFCQLCVNSRHSKSHKTGETIPESAIQHFEWLESLFDSFKGYYYLN